MAFFNGMGNKIAQAGQSTAQKAKEVAEIAKINGLISEEESTINNYYYQIGKLYAEKYGADDANEFSQFTEAIRVSNEKIKKLNTQIMKIRGVICCSKCGAEIAKGGIFCSFCGAAVERELLEPADTDAIVCSGCGATVEKTMRFCTNCGMKLSNMEGLEIEEKVRRCVVCGAEIPDGAAFCVECGAKI